MENNLLDVILNSINSDTVSSRDVSENLYYLYQRKNKKEREVINKFCISLCGYSFETLIRKSNAPKLQSDGFNSQRSLSELLEELKSKGINKVFVYYKDEMGKTQNIVYQNGVFFSVIDRNKIEMMNPLLVPKILEDIQNKKLKLVGKGSYKEPIKISGKFDSKF